MTKISPKPDMSLQANVLTTTTGLSENNETNKKIENKEPISRLIFVLNISNHLYLTFQNNYHLLCP